MAEGSTKDGLSKSRPVLGDLTNQIGKRGFSVREKSSIKGSDLNGKYVVKRTCVSLRPCIEINSLKGNAISGISKISTENWEPSVALDSNSAVDKSLIGIQADCLKENEVIDGKSKIHQGNKDINILDLNREDVVPQSVNELDVVESGQLNDSKLLDLTMGDDVQYINVEANEKLDDNLPAHTLRTVSETKYDCVLESKSCDSEANISPEHTQSDTNYHQSDMDDHDADNFVLSQSGSVDCVVIPESQESTAFGFDRSTKRKEDDCGYMSGGGIDSIKTCSCSFCTKAAYMLLDLHQQDIKGRVSAIKKNLKEAKILSERSCRVKGSESFSRVSKLESHLMHQWRTLFQRMSESWEEESNRLEASLQPLNQLREKCRTDLELMNSEKSEKH